MREQASYSKTGTENKQKSDRKNKEACVHFVGAGPGAKDLITVRGMELLRETDVVIYAGSLVNPELLSYAAHAETYNSAEMTLEEVILTIQKAVEEGKEVVRLHTGDQSVYGAVKEQMDALEEIGISYDSCPGVSACFGAAASLNLEYTLPGVSQTLIMTRAEGRTKVPVKERLQALSTHGASMAIYLSAALSEEVQQQLLAGGYEADTPAAVVYKATWPEEKVFLCTVSSIHETMQKNGIKNFALILVGDAIKNAAYERSRLYDPNFTTAFRKRTGEKD